MSLPTDYGSTLVTRGGAIGDFLLTLPAIALLRKSLPAARLDILGYPHVTETAVRAGLADAVRPLESATLAGFFGDPRRTPIASLDTAWGNYFAGFDLVVSYLSDPDGFFAENLHRVGVQRFVQCASKVDSTTGVHAVHQLARGLEEHLGLSLSEPAVTLRFGAEETAFADGFLRDFQPQTSNFKSLLALHPGSGGGERKNWPAERWLRVVCALLEAGLARRLLLVGGEADDHALEAVQRGLPSGRFRLARDLPLPRLGALLARCGLFLGHDSGVSHLAAIVGCPRNLLLFGPTDPGVWAPPHADRIHVLRAPEKGGDLRRLDEDTVRRAAESELAAFAEAR